MYKFCTHYEHMFELIVTHTCDYLHSNELKSMILGVSGGIDSALVAALAREVCARMDNKVKLIGRSLPIDSNTTDEIDRSIIVGKAFCHEFELHDYTEIYQAVSKAIGVRKVHNKVSVNVSVREGNTKARLRMIKLYDLAAGNKGMVLSTDNYTEYLLGFWTLHGDVGDFGMIQSLWKNEVYMLAGFLAKRFAEHSAYVEAEALKVCINAMPTDGLGITNSDFDQIYPKHNKDLTPYAVYKEIDTILYNHMHSKDTDGGQEVIKRHLNTFFKRENPYNIPRDSITT